METENKMQMPAELRLGAAREAAREVVGVLRDAEARASEDDGDEIDAEFNRRVLQRR